jgi:ATP-dependent RNA helicase DDX5/DBP2
MPEYRRRSRSPRRRSNSRDYDRGYGGGFGGGYGGGFGGDRMGGLGSQLKEVNWKSQTLTKFEKNFYIEHPNVR